MELFIQATVNGIITAGLYALIAYGVLILLGIMNVVNFAHGEFVMLGAFITYWAFSRSRRHCRQRRQRPDVHLPVCGCAVSAEGVRDRYLRGAR
jgi:branched-subunit amino acid ABC-type transport system permease component